MLDGDRSGKCGSKLFAITFGMLFCIWICLGVGIVGIFKGKFVLLE